jgi:hypothetical protein
MMVKGFDDDAEWSVSERNKERRKKSGKFD